MSNRSARRHWRKGQRINERRHGNCDHQWVGESPCVRCGRVRKSKCRMRPLRRKILGVR